ncbi:MAG: hypothetical protein LC723_13390 [Actinobacteria bacterium]|nr:hypothetical protein [Actinomycetota bacterium]
MTPKEVLLAAADLIENAPKLAKGVFVADADLLDDEGYFCTGPFQDSDGVSATACYCSEGAIMYAPGNCWGKMCRYRGDRDPATIRLAAYLGLRPSLIPLWNDAPERTKEEVVQAMRAAAA